MSKVHTPVQKICTIQIIQNSNRMLQKADIIEYRQQLMKQNTQNKTTTSVANP